MPVPNSFTWSGPEAKGEEAEEANILLRPVPAESGGLGQGGRCHAAGAALEEAERKENTLSCIHCVQGTVLGMGKPIGKDKKNKFPLFNPQKALESFLSALCIMILIL